MFCLVNEGIASPTIVGPDIKLFAQSGLSNKKVIGSNTGGSATVDCRHSYNIHSLLRKEVDAPTALMSTPIGQNPAADQSMYLAILAQNLDGTPATFTYTYMITIDVVVELTDLIED